MINTNEIKMKNDLNLNKEIRVPYIRTHKYVVNLISIYDSIFDHE